MDDLADGGGTREEDVVEALLEELCGFGDSPLVHLQGIIR